MVDDLIVLYDENETSFSSMGLGAISDAKSIVVYQARNAEYTLDMEYPISGLRYNDLKLRRIIYAKPDMYTPHQAFRITKITKDLGGIVNVEANHISYDLSNYPVKAFSAVGIVDTFVKLKQNFLIDNNFTFYTDKTALTSYSIPYPASCRSILGGNENSILNVFKGEYEFDNFNVKLLNARGTDRGFTINYGKNLTSFQDESESSSYSGVYPFYPYYIGYEEYFLELPEKVITIPGVQGTRILCLDMTDEFTDLTEVPTVAQLRAKANSYINEHNLNEDSYSYDLSFVPLENTEDYKNYALLQTVKLCDTVNIYVEPLNVHTTAKCTSIKYDCLLKKYVEINFGNIRANISDTVASNAKQASESPTQNDLSKLRKNITDVQVESEEREQLLDNFNSIVSGGVGLYKIENNGVYYFCNASTLASSTLIYKFDSGGFAFTFSWNGGHPEWHYGIDSTGNIIAKTITADYINALDIVAKRIQVKDSQNREIFLADSTDSGRACHIAGWIADGRKLYSERGSAATSLAGIYLTSANNTSESNWIKAINDDGTMFTVAKNGNVYCADIYCADINAANGSFSGTINAKGTGSIGDVDFNDGGVISANSLYLSNKLDTQVLKIDEATLSYTSSGSTTKTVYFKVILASVDSSSLSGSVLTAKVGCYTSSGSSGVLTECPKDFSVKVNVVDDLGLGYSLYVNFLKGQQTASRSTVFVEAIKSPLSSYSVDSSTSSTSDSTSVSGGVKINKNFLPNGTTRTLGDPSNKWNDIYAVNIHSDNTVIVSDRNLKTDINYDLTEYNDILNKLQPVVFKYKGQDKKHLGFIAQDVEAALDGREGLIDITNDIYGISYSEMHALEVLEIQKLNKKIEELEKKIDILTNGGKNG